MMKDYLSNSYLFGGNAPYVEELYEQYLDNPASVSEQWRQYFDNMQHVPASNGAIDARDLAHAPVVESFAQRAKQNKFLANQAANTNLGHAKKQVSVQSLIAAYRFLGARWAELDPLHRRERPEIPELEPSFYGLTEADLDEQYSASNTYFGQDNMSLRDILQALRTTYCGTLGAEFMYISDPTEKRWWQERLESTKATPQFSAEKKRRILSELTEAEGLERYLHTRYVGQKRFSLEGGESFIASMDELIQHSGSQGVKEIVIGMAHRGRLNVLVNTLGKNPADLFAEFEGKHGDDLPAGDVKYHQGFSSDVSTEGGPVHLSLAFNPSHLEIVNPVVEGSARARQDRRGDVTGDEVLPVQVHGDAAFAGQGVVMETLNLAQTRGYGTHGTIHIVINNQIGFTTSDPRDKGSTTYCSDVAKMIEAPVLHVNGDDPESVVWATQLALDYRKQFKKDVVLDIVCFRKLGHNEQDTPALTQPLMYKSIGKHPGTRALYAEKLTAQGVLKAGEADKMIEDYRAAMDEGRHYHTEVLSNHKHEFAADWQTFLNKKWADAANTSLPLTEIKRLGEKITTIPESFTMHPLVATLMKNRRAMANGEQPLDWGMGEHLAFASLLANGYDIRITGQDSGRGTFVHRHAVLHDQARERWNDGTYIPLQNVSTEASFTVIDSVLSEEAVLGFEYGYSTTAPNTLVIWEAQFGDFANGAQVVIDQFISSGEVKWGRASGLTLMLPHGYEGQGPEHSSARIERYLQLCADHNMQVVQPTTPAQIFHILRRQMVGDFRKPLIIFTPKSLLRHKEAISDLNDLAKGSFQTVIGEVDSTVSVDAKKVKRALVCSGKVYYDILAARREEKDQNVPVIRVEQMYPFPHKAFAAELKKYPNLEEIIWVQDEPQNQGPWFQIQHNLFENLTEGQKLAYAGRAASASPAVGYYAKHYEQQKAMMQAAFGKLKSFLKK
ncbi:2-oxoglutarate dehydrogenase subunit E1 [Formosimonas limnophila]|uniref:2-oxoglutarate dehydrogenase E1 component n=1 Tax=Formosimonas limnophila TaxID=1384487 RepID=A0A8J3CLE9_9BURK|nr:2-oxoglutarate dehydrogenase E1 component [Formosimonas limnophila]GHA65198.1 2-oxoglutarate dehydrogenase subunit E1 [Formosimonas limnophila]